MGKRTDKQNRRMWQLVGQLQSECGLNQDDAQGIFRNLLLTASGQESSKEVTEQEATRIIWALERLVARDKPESSKPQPTLPARDGRPVAISAAQADALEHLCQSLNMDKTGYASFCKRMIKVPWPQTREHAQKVYEGLEAMLRRRYTVDQLKHIAGSIAEAIAVSTEDRSFARSLLESVRKRKRISAGQISILLKIGRRYGLGLDAPPEPPVPAPP